MTDAESPVLIVSQDPESHTLGGEVSVGLGFEKAHHVTGSVADAIDYMVPRHISPRYILVDIGDARDSVIAELDALAPLCEPGTRVVVIGNQNDIAFYRALLDRGVIDYLPKPAAAADILRAFQQQMAPSAAHDAHVFAFMSAAAGDGSSTLAMNTAYRLSEAHKKPTILLDMDYQFGMVARNLSITSPFGIRELFDHPDRKVDKTLIERMAMRYSDHLHVISAPSDLRFLPAVRPESIRDLIASLTPHYDIIVLDLPHIWTTWVSAACDNADKIVLASQLWLKSVTHTSRILNCFRTMGVAEHDVRVVINRSGSKYKEAVSRRDFERVCNINIAHAISNDIRTVVQAENEGKTIFELGDSEVAEEIAQLAEMLLPSGKGATKAEPLAKPLSFLKRLT